MKIIWNTTKRLLKTLTRNNNVIRLYTMRLFRINKLLQIEVFSNNQADISKMVIIYSVSNTKKLWRLNEYQLEI